MESDETLYLKWNQFSENLKQSFTELKNKSYFFDVTLACEDKEIKAHKLILSACSPFFRRLLLKKSHQQANVHPLIYLRGVQAEQLEAVVAFIYQGEVNILEEQLDSFMLVAKDLQLKGLTALFDKQPNLFQQSLSKILDTEEENTDQEKYKTNENYMMVEEEKGENKSDLVKIETNLVNEDTEEMPIGENERILKELAAEGCLQDEEQKVVQSELVEIKTDVLNPEVNSDELVLHEESVKEILDASCLKDQEQRENLMDLKMWQAQKMETDVLVIPEYRGSKKKNLGQNECDVVVQKRCKERKAPTVRPGTERKKSSGSKEMEHQLQ